MSTNATNLRAIKLDTHEKLTKSLSPQQLSRRARTRIQHNLTLLADDMFPEAKQWLQLINLVDGPKAAFESYLKLLEFAAPKLSRAEVSVERSDNNGETANLSMEELQTLIREGAAFEHRTIEGESERRRSDRVAEAETITD